MEKHCSKEASSLERRVFPRSQPPQRIRLYFCAPDRNTVEWPWKDGLVVCPLSPSSQPTISLHQLPILSQNACMGKIVNGSSIWTANSSVPNNRSEITDMAGSIPMWFLDRKGIHCKFNERMKWKNSLENTNGWELTRDQKQDHGNICLQGFFKHLLRSTSSQRTT
mmetsp:Transcript_51644/g.124695  ORF Transcript_51644/g.124695 Transcript_51644/m.124695 type:complete len:166 (+) Transcript_51644:1401-1898(+)